MLIDRYIEENNIQNVEINYISGNNENREKNFIDEVNKKPESKRRWVHFSFWFFLGVFVVVSTINIGHATGVTILGIVFILISPYFLIKKSISKNHNLDSAKIISEKKERYEILQNMGEYEHLVVGKIYNEKKHEVTGSVKNNYIGNVYLLFPENASSETYGLTIINLEEKTQIIKYFSLYDITICKIIKKDFHNVDMEIDTSALEFASDRAQYAKIERSLVKEGFAQSISNDKKLLAEAEERKKLKKKIVEIDQKIKDETEILVLGFKDNSIYYISYVQDQALQRLQRKLESIK